MADPHPQLRKLDALTRAAAAGRFSAARGLLFSSSAGLALVNAAFELFECDALYDLAGDVARELRIDGEGFATGADGERLMQRRGFP